MTLSVKILILLVACTTALRAQTFHQVTATTGTQNIGGKTITVTKAGFTPPSTTGFCYGSMSYCIAGATTGGGTFTYSFNTPVYQLKFHFLGLGSASNCDSVGFSINGSPYLISTSQVSKTKIPQAIPPTCSPYLTGWQPVVGAGVLTATNSAYLYDSFVTVDIISPVAVNSIQVIETNLSNDVCQYHFYFADTGIAIQQPYIDTLKCPGDSAYLAYNAYTPFNTGNTFTAQLSNASGSFSSPTTIGTLSATGSGTIACKLPQNIAAGSGYRVRIVSSNPIRTSADNDSNIHIQSGPTTVPVAGSNAPFCAGGTLNLTSTSAGSGTSYSWVGPNSYTSLAQNPSISSVQVSHSGDYIVTASAGTCSRKDTVAVLIKPMPAIPMAGNNGPLCAGDSLALASNNTTAGVTYSWSGPASYSSSQQSPSILNVNSSHNGVYTVITTLNGCGTNAQTTVVIKPIPAVPTAGSNSPVCAGGTLNLTATSVTGGVTYSWSGPNGFTSNAQNPVINAVGMTAAGIYDVTTSLNGCTSTAGNTVVAVNNVSSIGAYPSPNDTICQMSPKATFVAVPNNGGSGPQYQWFKNGNLISGATNLSFPATAIANGDTFYCRMTVLGVCTDPLVLYSNKLGMTVLPPALPPAINIVANPSTPLSPWQAVSFTATPGGNAGSNPQYQWKRNGSDIIGATSNTWSANNLSDNDEISCVVTSSEWCANPASVESSKIAVHIKTGINDIGRSSRYRIYPNPATNELTIEGETGMRVTMLNMLGQEVHSGVLNSSKEIDISQLAQGHYVLQLIASDGSRSVVKVEKR